MEQAIIVLNKTLFWVSEEKRFYEQTQYTNLYTRGRPPPWFPRGFTKVFLKSVMTSKSLSSSFSPFLLTLRKEQLSLVRASVKAFKRLSPYDFWPSLYPPSTTMILFSRFLSRGNKARFSIWPPSLRSMIGGGIIPVLSLENTSLTNWTNELWTINHLTRKR